MEKTLLVCVNLCQWGIAYTKHFGTDQVVIADFKYFKISIVIEGVSLLSGGPSSLPD